MSRLKSTLSHSSVLRSRLYYQGLVLCVKKHILLESCAQLLARSGPSHCLPIGACNPQACYPRGTVEKGELQVRQHASAKRRLLACQGRCHNLGQLCRPQLHNLEIFYQEEQGTVFWLQRSLLSWAGRILRQGRQDDDVGASLGVS